MCYGLAQAWCFYAYVGVYSLAVALWWVVGVFLSNIGIPKGIRSKEVFKLDWKYVELVHGAIIGIILAF